MPRKRNLGRGIFERADGRLCGIIRQPNGDRKYIYARKGETANQFETRFDKLRQDAQNGMAIAPERMTLRQYLDQWIEVVTPTSAPLSPTAYRNSILSPDFQPIVAGLDVLKDKLTVLV